jgi:hypothetical protein
VGSKISWVAWLQVGGALSTGFCMRAPSGRGANQCELSRFAEPLKPFCFKNFNTW